MGRTRFWISIIHDVPEFESLAWAAVHLVRLLLLLGPVLICQGLCLAYKMGKMLEPGSWDLVLYDKNPELGGTWLVSRDRTSIATPLTLFRKINTPE